MSFQRARGPIMSDGIMFHNEDRTKAHHPYVQQPKESLLGLSGKHLFYERPISDDTSSRAKTKLVLENHGYSHTSMFGVQFKSQPIDPRYNLPKYGNQRPQALNYFRKSTNLLYN